MNTFDIINACFEFFAAIVLLLNIRAILKDKTVQGVSILPSVIFCVWGFWNIIYYSSLHQTASAIAAGFVGVVNLVWLTLVGYYKFDEWLNSNVAISLED